MVKGTRKLDPWEVALIKTMLASGAYNRDQIISYFTRPDRTVNPARISEIASGEIHGDVEPATQAQLDVYLRTFRTPKEAQRRFIEENPLHPVNLRTLFFLKDGSTDALHIAETDRVECKESIHLRGEGRSKFSRTIAGFANARGGFLLFGVRDADKVIVGVDAAQIRDFDGAILDRFLSDVFAPVPVWEPSEFTIAGKSILVLHVREAANKPIICTKNFDNHLKEGEIYYRYPSETRRIKYAELAGILEVRSRNTERQWADVLRHVEAAGVENVAILDTSTGEVSGRSGKFLIDEKLIPKLKFVAQGHFSETEGAPTLRLVGDMEPISMTGIHGAKTIVKKERLTDADLLHEFVDQAIVDNPRLYAGHLAHSTKLWLPIYYFMRQAHLDEAAAIRLLRDEPDTKSKHLDKVIDRVKTRKRPSLSRQYTPASTEPERSLIISKNLSLPKTEEQCERFLKAAITLKPGEIDGDYIMTMLKHCLNFFNAGKLGDLLIYVIAHIDVVWHEQIVKSSSTSSATVVLEPA